MNLLFQKDGSWQPLPHWAQFYIKLGSQLAKTPKVDTRLVVGIAAPTRAYAAAFLALGMVLQKAADAVVHEDAKEHFQYLSSFDRGTPVLLRVGGQWCKGKLAGPGVHLGQLTNVNYNSLLTTIIFPS